MKLDEIELALIVLEARLEEVKRFADVLNRVNRLTGVCGTHYYNRIQAIEIERARLGKMKAKLLKDMVKDNLMKTIDKQL